MAATLHRASASTMCSAIAPATLTSPRSTRTSVPASASLPHSLSHVAAPSLIRNRDFCASRPTTLTHGESRIRASTAVESGTDSISTVMHTLPSGLRMEVLVLKANGNIAGKKRPPLVLIHGSYHAAWCWAEHWMPYFTSRGFDCYATSILGQGGSDSPPDAKVAGTVQSHARDVSDVIHSLIGSPPVLVGHSFGGLIVQAYLADVAPPQDSPSPSSASSSLLHPLRGAVLACSVPPTGNMELVKRFIREKPLLSIRITLSLAAKMFASNLYLCRESFFSAEMPDSEVKRYQSLLKESSKMPLFDLRLLNASLPVPRPPPYAPPVMVLGAQNDTVVDYEGLKETAAFFHTSELILPSIAHDIMLDVKWEEAAKAVLSWLEEKVPSA